MNWQTIASTGNLVFGDELEALDREAARLKAEQGVDIIIALTHAGLEVDLEVAKRTQYADVIVGAHSHTLLYNGAAPQPISRQRLSQPTNQQPGLPLFVSRHAAFGRDRLRDVPRGGAPGLGPHRARGAGLLLHQVPRQPDGALRRGRRGVFLGGKPHLDEP